MFWDTTSRALCGRVHSLGSVTQNVVSRCLVSMQGGICVCLSAGIHSLGSFTQNVAVHCVVRWQFKMEFVFCGGEKLVCGGGDSLVCATVFCKSQPHTKCANGNLCVVVL